MDKKNIQKLIQDSILCIIFLILSIGGGIYMLIPHVKTVIQNNQTVKTKQEELTNLQRKVEEETKVLEEKKKLAEKKDKDEEQAKSAMDKPFFKTTIAGSDSFSANTALFEDIIKIIKANRLKLVSIENKMSGFEDPIAQNSGAQYNACMIDMQMLGTYSRFQKFLTYLYDYPYLINIASVEVIPFDKDKNTLIINMSVILYSELISENGDTSN